MEVRIRPVSAIMCNILPSSLLRLTHIGLFQAAPTRIMPLGRVQAYQALSLPTAGGGVLHGLTEGARVLHF